MNCLYFPYLRGKQAELMALREFSQNCSSLLPFVLLVIEPVKDDSSFLERSAKVMMENGMKFSIVLNPKSGDFEGLNTFFLESLSAELRDGIGQKWFPAIFCWDGGIPEHFSFPAQNSLLVFQGRIEYSNRIKSYLESPHLSFILDGTEKSRGFSNYLLSLEGKKVVRLDDNFRGQPRNADYANVPDELFSETPWYFKKDGYTGIADYTVFPRISLIVKIVFRFLERRRNGKCSPIQANLRRPFLRASYREKSL